MSTSELSCIFCKESFDDKEQLQIHFRKHGDPKFNQNARSGNSEPSEAEKSTEEEVVACDVCSDVFPTISKAITHKHKTHPDHDAKYFCPWCGKLFTMKHLYNKHIESSHSSDETAGSGFHCDYCDVDFFAAAAMVYHNKFFHRQDTELASIGFSKKLKHFEQEILPIHYCPFCGEEYFNKVNLHKHMGDDHIDENQSPDDVLRCPLCEAIFYHLDAYELHLTFHSSDDLYNDENDLVKSITEFSLEAVPPLMEKVENELQEDDNNSMGIEKLLQQAMNENDNEDLNSEGLPHKKKKHKKHKKSRKATITLDEFLSMNTEVFGEGLDLQVQGIVEVPSQVVANQLRKPQNMRKRPTAMQSKEIEKLRKAGIVIKKKPGKPANAQPYAEVKVTNNKQFKLPVVPPTKKTPMSTTSDVLNKLLNQGNSQIKIVKKSSQDSANSETEMDTDPDLEDAPMETEDGETKAIDKTNESNKTSVSNHCPDSEEIEEVDITKPIPLKWKDDPPYDNSNLKTVSEISMKTKSGTARDVLKNISQHITIKSFVNSKNNTSDNAIEKEQKASEQSHSDSEANEERLQEKRTAPENQIGEKGSLNALKHLSHLTVKSVNQGKSNPLPENSEAMTNPNENLKVEKTEADKVSKSLEALKNISKNITVKSPSKSPQVIKSYDSDYENGNDDIDQDQSGTESQSNALDVLKKLGGHLTVKAPKKSSQAEKNLAGKVDDENEMVQDEPDNATYESDDGEKERAKDVQKPKNLNINHQYKQNIRPVNALINIGKNITIKAANKSPKVVDNVDEHQNSQDRRSINVLKNIGKHITVKDPNKSAQVAHNTDEHDSEHEDMAQDELDSDANDSDENQNKDSKSTNSNNLDALKKISKNITIKAPNKASQVVLKRPVEKEIPESHNYSKKLNNSENKALKCEVKNELKHETKSIDTLKNISKHITVKSLNKPKNDVYQDEEGDNSDTPLQKYQSTKAIGKSPVAMKAKQHFKSPEIRKVSVMNSPGTGVEDRQITKMLPSDVLKQFPNITAKSFNVTKTQQVTSSSQSMQFSKGKFVQKSMKMEQKSEAIETFSIDDSEDEEAYQIPKAIMPSPNNKSTDALNVMKKLNSNITIKPSSKQTLKEMEDLPSTGVDEPHDEHFDEFEDLQSSEHVQQKNTVLQDTLKSLGKNISIKSSNSLRTSPKSQNTNPRDRKDSVVRSPQNSNPKFCQKSQQNKNAALANTLKNISKHISVKSTKTSNLAESKELKDQANQDDSDSDTDTKVKITEMANDGSSDDETITTIQDRIKGNASNMIVEHPKESNSEDEEFDPSNIEDQIKPSIIKKQLSESSAENKLVKYVNQNPRLKELQDFNWSEEDECETEDNPDLGNLSTDISIKSSVPTKFQGNKNTNRQIATSGRVNTVNKEVTVETFKTQTVIEEVTTTVTKTIRRVNQSMNQEFHSTNQTLVKPQIRQRVPGLPPGVAQNNFKNVQVRQPRPNMGAGVRNSAPQIRSTTVPFRPSSQTIRPNFPRPNNPRMPIARRANMIQNEYKTIKIAPNAMVPNKRPQEPTGHFSCFKKPKESLIPVADIPTMSHQSIDTGVQFKSAQMRKCNFTSSTKVVKGNSVVTSKKSQSSASTELSKLNNMSGLKVVKTSQQQMVQEERREVSAPKRNALEAIERLQRQGLLIKKPRVDDNQLEDDHHEPSDDDEEFDDET